MKFSPILLVIVISLTGCVSSKHVALSEQAIGTMQGKSLSTTKRIPPQYDDVTTTDGLKLSAVGVAGGAVGGAIFGAVNDFSTQVINDAQVQDPAIKIKQALSQHLAIQAGIRIIPNSQAPLEEGSLKEQLQNIAPETDYILDVETIRWLNVYLPTKWGRYRVVYKVRCSLYQTGQSKPMGEATVFWNTPDDYEHPTHAELFADDAKELKKQLNMAADYAIEYFKENVLP